MKFLTTAAFAVSTLAGAASAEGLSLQLNWTAGGDHAPLYYALQEGWFADAGVELEIRQGSGSGAAATALDVGQAEVAIIDTPTALQFQAKGSNFTGVMVAYNDNAAGTLIRNVETINLNLDSVQTRTISLEFLLNVKFFDFVFQST